MSVELSVVCVLSVVAITLAVILVMLWWSTRLVAGLLARDRKEFLIAVSADVVKVLGLMAATLAGLMTGPAAGAALRLFFP